MAVFQTKASCFEAVTHEFMKELRQMSEVTKTLKKGHNTGKTFLCSERMKERRKKLQNP